MSKKIFIFGATSGLGQSLAKLFIKKGFKIISISSSNRNILKDINLQHHKIDLRNKKNYKKVFSIIKKNKNKIYLFIYCSGALTVGKFYKIPKKIFDSDINLNANALIEIVRYYLKINKSINLITILSNVALHGVQNLSSYSISKAMIKNFTETLRLEMQNSKIMSVFPGKMKTKFDKKALVLNKKINFKTQMGGIDTDDLAKKIISNFEKKNYFYINIHYKIIHFIKFISDKIYEKILKFFFLIFIVKTLCDYMHNALKAILNDTIVFRIKI